VLFLERDIDTHANFLVLRIERLYNFQYCSLFSAKKPPRFIFVGIGRQRQHRKEKEKEKKNKSQIIRRR